MCGRNGPVLCGNKKHQVRIRLNMAHTSNDEEELDFLYESLDVSTPPALRVRFQPLYNHVESHLKKYDKQMRKIIDYNGHGPFIATMCMGLICCLRTYETIEDKKHAFGQLLEAYKRTLRHYSYTAKNHSTHGRFAWLKWNKIKLQHVPREVIVARIPDMVNAFMCEHDSDADEYYTMQKHMHDLFSTGLTESAFHEDYNNYLTFVAFCFFNMVMRSDTGPHECILHRFITSIVDFHLQDDDHTCLYDNYDRVTGSYDV